MMLALQPIPAEVPLNPETMPAITRDARDSFTDIPLPRTATARSTITPITIPRVRSVAMLSTQAPRTAPGTRPVITHPSPSRSRSALSRSKVPIPTMRLRIRVGIGVNTGFTTVRIGTLRTASPNPIEPCRAAAITTTPTPIANS